MRWIISAALIATLGAATAQAQTPSSAAAAVAPNDKLAGNWEGTFTTDGPVGAMTMTLTKGSPWKIAAALDSHAPPGSEPRDLVVSGETATWKQTFGEYDVTFKATLGPDGSGISGMIEASQGGNHVAGGTFTLKRKA